MRGPLDRVFFCKIPKSLAPLAKLFWRILRTVDSLHYRD
jgi:hypothetical protein